MFNKTCVIIILILVTQQVCRTHSKTLPVTIDDDDGENKTRVRSYYRQNIFGPKTIAFGFEVNDRVSGNMQFRDERHYANGTIRGLYGYLQPDGNMIVTHFLADGELGYLSQTTNISPGDEPHWQENWPSKRPNMLMENSLESSQSESADVGKEILNLTSVLLPVKMINKDDGIDLNPPELEKQLVNPVVLKVLSGENTLLDDQKNKSNSVEIKMINKFIPKEFPIVPFELPHAGIDIVNLNEGLSANPIPVIKRTNDSDTSNMAYNLRLPANNSSPDEEPVKNETTNAKQSFPTPGIKMSRQEDSSTQAKSNISIEKNSDWYEKVIQQTRQEYLENVD